MGVKSRNSRTFVVREAGEDDAWSVRARSETAEQRLGADERDVQRSVCGSPTNGRGHGALLQWARDEPVVALARAIQRLGSRS